MTPIFFPYHMRNSASRVLARRLNDTWRVYPDRNYRHRDDHLVINWGNGSLPRWYEPNRKWLNHPEYVSRAINKKTAFQRFNAADIPCPEWTVTPEVAQAWHREGHFVVGRQSTTSFGGRGIVLYDPKEPFDSLPPCRLYTKHLRHKDEYRVHVFRGKVIDFQKKKKRRETDVDYKIRSWDNGWVFCREGVTLPDEVADVAIDAVMALGLDFGGVDVAHRVKEDVGYVLEVNTAPGIEGTTLLSYQWAIEDALQSM